MRCSGLHCGGCRSGGGGSRLVLLLVACVNGLFVVPRIAGSALAGLSASVAEANRAVGLGMALVLVVGAVTAGGLVLLARRRQLNEKPVVTEFSAQVQAALDARDRAREGLRHLAPPASPAPVPPAARLRRVTAYRLDRGPTPGSFAGGNGS